MRKTQLFVTCGALLLLGVAGCSRDAAVDTDVAKTPPADTTPAEPTPAPAPTPATPAPAGTLTLATGAPGSYVADNTGRAVYVLEGDENGSKCTADCLAAWPPLLADPAPVAGASLQGVLIGTVERSDGTTQVTYNGHPLYLYSKDTTAGTTMGQDVTDKWGEWYLVGPTGVAMDDDDSDAGVTAEVPPEMDPVDPVKDPVKTDAPPPTY